MNRDARQRRSAASPIERHPPEHGFSEDSEPIAIVGMACRFPGADDLSAFWRLLDDGVNAVTEGIPGSGVGRIGELFPDPDVEPRACRFGAYLENLDQFDAAFFRISPVEAQMLDPQQRLMLETCWRALEDAGMDPDGLKGSRTGVYAGISNNEYRGLIMESSETAEAAASLYAVTGTSFNTAIGRVAYALGLEGPALALDTACSSSLVAIHQAASGLQRGEADLAMAGGVHTILSGRLLELRAKAGMLSPDGRCATFDAAAYGYVRGEGCGIVVLKRLAEAEADGDRIWGVIRGSALNQDGASPGLTVPSEPAQEKVIAAALERAGIAPTEVDYVEAHGTGTEVGDPVEVQATGTAYGYGRGADRPLLIGSVKTNIGHLEAAAGVAGVIKVILAMNRGVIPRHLHFSTPNPVMDWDQLPLEVTATPTDWPLVPARPPRAGVSGFGWSGTNAHVILEGYGRPDGAAAAGPEHWAAGPAKPVSATFATEGAQAISAGASLAERAVRLLPLSGKTDAALDAAIERHLAWLDQRADALAAGGQGADVLADMAWTASIGRSHFSRRAGVVFRDAESLREALLELSDAGEGGVSPPAGKVAFAFTGQASQWVGMGAALYESEPVMRTVLDRCDALLRDERNGGSLLDVMFGRPASTGDLDDPQWKQPAIYALECALTELWSSVGIRPDVVFGHSLGEIAAAQCAGVFSLEDGLRFAAARGALIGALPGEGAMAAIFAPPSRVAAALDEHNAGSAGIGLCIAADNGAHQVISGPRDEIEELLERLEAQDVRVARLRKSPAYHSAMVEPALDGLATVLSDITFSPPSLTFVSNLTGEVVGAANALDADYWLRQARSPVAFRGCVEALAAVGVDAVVEIGPHAVLGPMTTLAWPESSGNATPTVLASLRRPPKDEAPPAPGSGGGFVEAVAEGYAAGLPIDFTGLFAGEARRRISLPGYPFQRERHWVETSKRRRHGSGHPLLGERHDSASGETVFDTEVLPSDPAWLNDHQVFGHLVVPGALYGAMAASASLLEGGESAVVEDFQIQTALVFRSDGADEASDHPGRRLQVLLGDSEDDASRRVRLLSRADGEEVWTLHAEGRIATSRAAPPDTVPPLDLDRMKAGLSPVELPAYYRAKVAVGIDLGPSFRTLEALWSGPGEALGEITLPAGLEDSRFEVHPLVLDGCFQVMGAAREWDGDEGGITYLPFAWERLCLPDRLPDQLICHVQMRAGPAEGTAGSEDAELREVQAADLRLYDRSGHPVGQLSGFTVKRATRAALLSAIEGIDDLLYQVVWRDSALPPGMPPADFLTLPSTVAGETDLFTEYLGNEGVGAEDRANLLADLEQLAHVYAVATLDGLGWERTAGAEVDSTALRKHLGVGSEHERLFRRLLEMLTRGGILEEAGDGFRVAIASGEPLPAGLADDPDTIAARMAEKYAHGSNEIGLFRRSAAALPEVLRGDADPLTLLFSSGEPTAADLYLKAPVARAANRMLAEATATLLRSTPAGRRLRILEVGAGTGSATAAVLPELPEGSYDYAYTDISAGFFAEAEARFGGPEASIDYRVLDIEKDPIEQGFDRHGYDLLIASNVLHATRYLNETLAHCRALLAPSGQLVALENLRSQGWLDLTFGQLDGWWRFADSYRPHHALARPGVWREALGDAGFEDIAILGFDESDPNANPDRGVIVAQGPAEVTEAPGVWVLAGDQGGVADELARELAGRNQAVVLVGADGRVADGSEPVPAGLREVSVETEQRTAWTTLFQELPGDAPLAGVVHLLGLDGHGTEATTSEMAEDIRQATATALAMAQGVADADAEPAKGVWFITRGPQVLEIERGGILAGATLWGLGKVMAREAPQLQPRMLDLDTVGSVPCAELVNELLYPDSESHIAYRFGRRQCARLVSAAAVVDRLALPDEPGWALAPDAGGALDGMHVESLPERALEPGEIRASIEAFGLNFRDVFIAIGLVEDSMGGEFCGRVLEVADGVSSVTVGDRVVGLTFRAFGSETVTLEQMVAPAPDGFSVTELATMPTAFVSAALSFELSGLNAGDRVLIHAGAGGVGLAAIQLAHAAGAEVFATASERKRDFLRSLGVTHVFDSRTTSFGEDVLAATAGAGVDMVLNSLTGEGFIETSLSCLAQGGRFVEMARVDILSEEEMAAKRPDVAYAILAIDALKEEDPVRAGDILRRVLGMLEAGTLTPLPHARWPLAEAGPAMECMRAGRHVGKIVLTNSPLARGRLRADRSYLVTGGLGGIGCAVAGWLAERGAGVIVLNGRRPPDSDVAEAIEVLRRRGSTVQVELADVTDADAIDAMVERMDVELPPLGGVIHSVGVLSDAAIGNQSWETFETVLWPKLLGAWHLHRATVDRDLDMFVLFSSVAGVLGNPGQSNHAAANAFLDQLAAHRRALGLPGQAIAWGAWSEIGEAEEQRERMTQRSATSGIEWITPQQGLRSFDRLVREDAATGVVLARDWVAFGESLEVRPPFLEEVLADDAEDGTQSSSEDLLSRLRDAPAGTREEELVSYLQGEVQAVLRLPAAPQSTVGFFDLGMDSLMAVELRNRLNRALAGAYTVSNTAVFDYPNIAVLATHLTEELVGVVGASTPAVQPGPSHPPTTPGAPGGEADAVAIVGMACRFPGARNLPAFWDLLAAGTDALRDERREARPWSDFLDLLPDQYSAYCRGGFVEGIDQFDAKFFGISPIEARLIDPQQRMLLETGWQAFEDAGINPDRLSGSRTGVYVGVATSEYRDLMKNGDYGIGYLSTAASMAVGRLAFYFGLAGPTMPVELNCASSLVAVHQAVDGLRLREADLALAGGVSAVLSAPITREMADLGLLSREGSCKTFDAAADGFVRGEGCGMVVLKRLADAEADGDRIWAVIRGTAVNQNGASAGPTVPNGSAQERVISQALSQAGIAPSDVDYLEAHGAGSAFGDPIEVQAAAAVYGQERPDENPLLIGSVKTNIGHLESAAGIAGLMKTVLAMSRKVVPQHLNFDKPSPLVEWDRLPVQVASATAAWPAASGRPPRAGVSAFGISGVNAHVVLEGHEGADGGEDEDECLPEGAARRVPASLPQTLAGAAQGDDEFTARDARLLPLSAKSGGALQALAGEYLAWLDERTDLLSTDGDASGPLLSDMAWTAGVGRSHLDVRAGVVFRDTASLRERLQALAKAESNRGNSAGVKLAFVYADEIGSWAGVSKALYESEPVVRAVLDRCETVLRDERGGSLLEAMFERGGPADALNHSELGDPAAYALACALTALWSSIGIRPSVVGGRGAGEIAAAQAAGVFDLEDGLRIASIRSSRRQELQNGAGGGTGPGEQDATLDQISFEPPSIGLLSSATGQPVEPGKTLDAAYWRVQMQESSPSEHWADALAKLEVRVVVEIGAQAAQGSASENGAAAPVLLSSLRPTRSDGTSLATVCDTGFVDAAARAYEAGLPVSFEGLFAGEERRRVSLPGYPFQRLAHWLQKQQT